MKATLVYKGGPGSGNFGHSGRPGKIGGSSGGSGGGKYYERDELALNYPKLYMVVGGDMSDYFTSPAITPSISAIQFRNAEREISNLSQQQLDDYILGDYDAVAGVISIDTDNLVADLVAGNY